MDKLLGKEIDKYAPKRPPAAPYEDNDLPTPSDIIEVKKDGKVKGRFDKNGTYFEIKNKDTFDKYGVNEGENYIKIEILDGGSIKTEIYKIMGLRVSDGDLKIKYQLFTDKGWEDKDEQSFQTLINKVLYLTKLINKKRKGK